MDILPFLEDYLAIARRRVWHFVSAFIVILILGVGVVLTRPVTYLSTGKIGVESQQIPEDFVRSTVRTQASERVGLIQQRVMTITSLEQIIDKFKLYPEAGRQRLIPAADTPLDRLRKHIKVNVIKDPFAGHLGAIAFTVSFEHGDPETAQQVAAELVDLFLEENVKTRTARARETTDFLREQATKFHRQARAIDEQIAEYKQRHHDALPEHLNLKTDMLRESESERRSLEREISSLEEEKRYLETQRASVAALLSAGSASNRPPMSLREQLTAAKAELAVKSGSYTKAHPDMRRLMGTIAALERQIRSERAVSGELSSGQTTDPVQADIDSKMRTIVSRLRLLRDRKQELDSKTEQLQAQILETPQVDIVLRELSDKYQSSMQEFSAARSKQQDAEMAQTLEQEEKAERFVLLEKPRVPREPARSALKLVVMAFLLAIGGGAGVAYAAELLDNKIYGRRMLATELGHSPLVVIPYLAISPDGVSNKVRWRLVLVTMTVLLVAAVVVFQWSQQQVVFPFAGPP